MKSYHNGSVSWPQKEHAWSLDEAEQLDELERQTGGRVVITEHGAEITYGPKEINIAVHLDPSKLEVKP